MEKRRASRHDIPLLSTVGDSSQDDHRLSRSSRLSGIELTHIADGFRPVSPLSPSISPDPFEERPNRLRRSVSLPAEHESNNRSSIAKGGPHDLGMGMGDVHHQRANSATEDDHFDPNTSRFTDRPGSAASSSHYSPSSPYRTRISRISFSYPRRPTTPSGSQMQPTHPYGLYQQTTFEEPEEIEEPHIQLVVPIGFPGRSNTNTFQRRTGPDGEELDVVGPEGHLEQLPPYSRYPEAGPIAPKTAIVTSNPGNPILDAGAGASGSHPAMMTPVIPSTAVSPIIPSAPGTPHSPMVSDLSSLHRSQSQIQQPTPLPQPIPQAHIQPQPQPQQISRSPSGPTTDSLTSTNGSRALQSSASSLAEEKRRRNEGWGSIKRKRVLCGFVPVWAVVLISLLALFLAIIAGGVLGGMLSQPREKKHRNHKDAAIDDKIASSMWDASPIPAPTGIPPIPTGTFFFPLGAAEQQERSCIQSSKNSIAWSCNTPPTLMLIDFQMNAPFSPAKLTISPAPMMAGSGGIAYGPQPPKLDEQALMWVTDLRDTSKGPALHFQTAYDKVVIFDPNSFPSTNLQRRHDMMPADQGLHNHRFANTPGESPWYCYWNQTFIEGFIFIQQPVQGAETQRFQVSSMSVMHSQMVESASTTAASISPTSPATSTISPTSLSSSNTSPQPQLAPRATLYPRNPDTDSSPTPAISSSSSPPDPSASPTQTQPPSRFPYIVKLEERRLPNPLFQPFCQRMQVLPDGQLKPFIVNGNPVIETLREAPIEMLDAQVTAGVVSGQSGHKKGKGGSNSRVKRGWDEPLSWEIGVDEEGMGRLVRRTGKEPGNSCHCVWVSPYN